MTNRIIADLWNKLYTPIMPGLLIIDMSCFLLLFQNVLSIVFTLVVQDIWVAGRYQSNIEHFTAGEHSLLSRICLLGVAIGRIKDADE